MLTSEITLANCIANVKNNLTSHQADLVDSWHNVKVIKNNVVDFAV